MVIITERCNLCLGQYEPCWFWYRFRSCTRVHILVVFARWSGLQADVSLGTRQVSSIVRVVSNDLPTNPASLFNILERQNGEQMPRVDSHFLGLLKRPGQTISPLQHLWSSDDS